MVTEVYDYYSMMQTYWDDELYDYYSMMQSHLDDKIYIQIKICYLILICIAIMLFCIKQKEHENYNRNDKYNHLKPIYEDEYDDYENV